jgi:hypothetical protein
MRVCGTLEHKNVMAGNNGAPLGVIAVMCGESAGDP